MLLVDSILNGVGASNVVSFPANVKSDVSRDFSEYRWNEYFPHVICLLYLVE